LGLVEKERRGEEKVKKKKRSGRIGLRIVLGATGGILFGFGLRDLMFSILPSSLQTPLFGVALGFILLFIAAKI